MKQSLRYTSISFQAKHAPPLRTIRCFYLHRRLEPPLNRKQEILQAIRNCISSPVSDPHHHPKTTAKTTTKPRPYESPTRIKQKGSEPRTSRDLRCHQPHGLQPPTTVRIRTRPRQSKRCPSHLQNTKQTKLTGPTVALTKPPRAGRRRPPVVFFNQQRSATFYNMVSQKLEICIELVKTAVLFVSTVAESVEEAFRKPPPALPAAHDGRRNKIAEERISINWMMILSSTASEEEPSVNALFLFRSSFSVSNIYSCKYSGSLPSSGSMEPILCMI
ncbi:hypothetical protein YC2023_061715 [Brassica napus]